MDDFLLRPYDPADAEMLFELDRICFGPEFRFTLRDIRHLAGRPNALDLVATHDGVIIGFIIAHIESTRKRKTAYVDTIDVAPGSRRTGIASRMLAEIERQCTISGTALITLHVHVGNAEAIRFYERHGYRRLRIEPGFYGSAGLDAAVYTKPLN